MKIHRFIGPFDLGQHHLMIRDPELFKQLRSVLKLQTGERIILSTGKGEEALFEIGGYGKDSVSVNLIEPLVNSAEPKVRTILYCAILKREHFELVAQKATEVGVHAIVPVISKRTIKLNVRGERIEKIIREAAEQSGRGLVPELHEAMELNEAFEHAKGNAFNYFFDPTGDVLVSAESSDQGTGLFIGPEGGWDETEIAAARDRGIPIVSFSKLIMRAETAAIIATYLFTK